MFKINAYLNSIMNILFYIVKEIKSVFVIFLFTNVNLMIMESFMKTIINFQINM